MRKKVLCLALILALCLGLLAVPAGASSVVGDFIIDDGVLIAYTGSGGDVTVSHASTIGKGAFKDCTSLTSVEMPYVSHIEYDAFQGCTGLREVTFSDRLESIGNSAFEGCVGLTEVTVPESVNYISVDAFANCSNLDKVTLPQTAAAIDPTSFRGTPWLERQDEFVTAGGLLFAYRGRDSHVVIPEGVTKIGNEVFLENSTLRSVTFPSTLKEIGTRSFANCVALDNVTIPDSVTALGSGAFLGCSSLSDLSLPDNIAGLDGGTFEGTAWMDARSSDSGDFVVVNGVLVTYLGQGGDVVIPSGVTAIGDGVFWTPDVELNSVVIPEGVTSIGGSAFTGHSELRSVTLPDSLTEIKGNAFYGCKGITQLKLPKNLRSIWAAAFADCKGLRELDIPGGVEEVASNAFTRCDHLRKVTFHPGAPLTVDYYAFAGCKQLTDVVLSEDSESIDPTAFRDTAVKSVSTASGHPPKCYINIDEEGVLTEFLPPTQDLDMERIVVPEGVTALGAMAFFPDAKKRPEPKLRELVLPESLTRIGWSALAGNGLLEEVRVPSKVTVIEGSAFFGCVALKRVELPDGLLEIGSSAFESCTALVDIKVPSGLRTLGGKAFCNCPAITQILDLPALRTIPREAYAGCTGLRDVVIPDTVVTIEDAAFRNSSVTSVTIPSTVTRIKWEAFKGCGSLKDVYIPASVTDILQRVFNNPVDDTWPGMYKDLVIHGVPGSEAERWATSHGLPFVGDMTPEAPRAAYTSFETVTVDGTARSFNMYALKTAQGYDTNYIGLRDLAKDLTNTPAQFQVTWDQDTGSILIQTGAAYLPPETGSYAQLDGDQLYQMNTAQILVDGRPAALEAILLTDENGGGHTYYKLRDLGAALGFTVGWSAEDGIYVRTGD